MLRYSTRSTTLAKKIETGTQAKRRRVHARQITRLCHVHAVVSIFLARVVHTVVERFLTSNKMFLAKSDLQRRSLFARNILLEVKKRSTTVCYQLLMLSTVSGGEPSFGQGSISMEPRRLFIHTHIHSPLTSSASFPSFSLLLTGRVV